MGSNFLAQTGHLGPPNWVVRLESKIDYLLLVLRLEVLIHMYNIRDILHELVS